MWVEKDGVLVLAGVGGRGAGRRKEGLLGGERGWKVKTGEEAEDRGEDMGEDSGEEKVEMVDGDTGESCSEPEREEEEPETKTDKEDTVEATGQPRNHGKHSDPNPTYLD